MLKFSSHCLSLAFIIVEIIIIKSVTCFYEKLEINSIVIMISLLLITNFSPFSSLLSELSNFTIV